MKIRRKNIKSSCDLNNIIKIKLCSYSSIQLKFIFCRFLLPKRKMKKDIKKLQQNKKYLYFSRFMAAIKVMDP